MKADMGKTVSMAMHYSAKPKRMLPFFILMLPFLAAVLLMLNQVSTIIPALVSGNVSAIFGLLGYVAVFAVIFVVVSLIDIYLKTLVVENSKQYWSGNDRLLSREKAAVKGAYFSALAASIIVALVIMAVSFIPFIGGLLSIIISLYFFTFFPAVVMKKSVNGLSDSTSVFSKSKLETFVFWIVLSILTAVFSILSFIPALIAILASLGSAISTIITGGGMLAALSSLQSNILILAIGGIITAFLFSFAVLFDASSRPFYYLQHTKKEPEAHHEPVKAAVKVKRKKKR